MTNLPFTFTARFDGECSVCLDDVLEGEEAGWVDNEFACHDCVKDAVFHT